MSWYRKEQPTPFDNQPIDGLLFLNGDMLAAVFNAPYLKGEKSPVVEFPSGHYCDIWETANPHLGGIIHIFGELDVPYRQNREDAYDSAQYIAGQIGYVVKKVGEMQLDLIGFDDDEHFRITYDNEARHMVNVEQIKGKAQETATHPAHILMSEDIKAQLPPLHANEDIGLEAIAPIKYFHVNGWTWYASEYDPEHEVFFGLVDGYEIELGYFSLAELQEVGKDGRTLPIERDLYYSPKTLKELQDYHRKLRQGGA